MEISLPVNIVRKTSITTFIIGIGYKEAVVVIWRLGTKYRWPEIIGDIDSWRILSRVVSGH